MRRLCLTLALCSLSASAFAQNPVSIQQIGPSTAVTTTVPVSGTVTATQSTASSLNATVVQGTASALNATVVGTGTFVVQAQQSGSWSATVSQATASSLNATVVGTGTFATQATLQAGSNLAGEIAPVATATTTDAFLTSAVQSAASTNSTSVKGSAGNVYLIHVQNTNDTAYYLRLYNTSSAPTCSSATGFVESILIPKSSLGGVNGRAPAVPQGFTTGIGYCVTGGFTSTDNTNAATGILITIGYK